MKDRPGPDVPSAEILDELLKAFAVDTSHPERLEQVDLESAAVQELLEGDVTKHESQPEPEPVVEVETTPPPAPIVIDATHEPADPTPPSVPEGTIFIDDRLTGETVALEAATGTTRVEPRFRERRIAVRRAAGRKRLRWAAVGLVVVLVVIGALAVLGSSLFAIDDVEVEGAVYTDEERLAAVVDDLLGTPVLRADTDLAERELEAIPWVEDARVHLDFPHGAKIEIRERAPSATFEGPDGRWRVIDDDGRVLDVLDSQPVDYILVLSADPPSSDAGQGTPPGFGAAASLVQALTPELRSRAQSVSVTPDGSDLRLLLDDGLEVRFGVAQDLVTKLVRLQTRLDQLEGGGFSYIDVSTNEVTTG